MYSHALKTNGGQEVFGTHRECFRKGYARGYNQTISDMPKFLQKWTGKYKAYVEQKLWHSDEPVPPGYQRALLSQTMQRGYAIGSIVRAKHEQRHPSLMSQPSKSVIRKVPTTRVQSRGK